MEHRQRLGESEALTPAAALSYGTIAKLAVYLNPRLVVGYDWRALASSMGYDYQFIRNLEEKRSPTEDLLSTWMGMPEAKCGSLVKLLEEGGRNDALEEVLPLLVRDIEEYEQRQGRPSAGVLDSDYDAYVSYAPEDFGFVRELMTRLEIENSFKLCIADRDILLGESSHSVTAKLIDERCKRVIIVISKNYINSDECDWQLKFAHALAPGAHRYNRLLPLIIDSDVKRPSILLPYVVNDYTRLQTREWFWRRLIDALRADIGQNGHYTGDRESLPYPRRAPIGIPPPSYRSESGSSSNGDGDGSGNRSSSQPRSDSHMSVGSSSVFVESTRSASVPSLPGCTSKGSNSTAALGSLSLHGSTSALAKDGSARSELQGDESKKKPNFILNMFKRKTHK